MTKKDNNKAKPNRFVNWVNGYIYLTAMALALVGFFLLCTLWATWSNRDSWVNWNDPLLGISNRALLVVGGLLHLGIAAYLFSTRNLLGRILAISWLGLNHLIYYAGITVIEPNALPNIERFFGWRLQILPTTVDFRWKVFIGYLIITGVGFFTLLWCHSRHYSKQLKEETWLKQWQEKREQNISQEKPLIQKPQANFNGHVKISCPFCDEHIEFPTYALGRKISCPHCNMNITLEKKV